MVMSTKGEILYEFVTEEVMAPEVLSTYIMFYPELAADLLELYNQLNLISFSAELLETAH